jgi:hypothetical protein
MICNSEDATLFQEDLESPFPIMEKRMVNRIRPPLISGPPQYQQAVPS